MLGFMMSKTKYDVFSIWLVLHLLFYALPPSIYCYVG